ncbi:hypothetical protein ACA910_002852 [Epithemia clementina (nom. ined.)]
MEMDNDDIAQITKQLQLEQDSASEVEDNFDEDEVNDVITMNRWIGKDDLSISNLNQNTAENTYTYNQVQDSDLVINNIDKVIDAYKNTGPMGLLLLFIPSRFCEILM